MKKLDVNVVSKIAHEFFSPLVSSKWAIDILLSEPKENLMDKEKEHLTNIQSNLERIKIVSDKILNYVKFSINELKPIPSNVDLIQIIDRYVDIFSKRSKMIVIEKLYSPDTKIVVHADASYVDFAILNLIHNALIYCKETGKVSISTSIFDGIAKIEISDTGIGIPLEDQCHIFEEFFRGSNANETNPKGIGLSLFLIKCMSKALGGDINFVSEKGKGSTFNLTFPLSARS